MSVINTFAPTSGWTVPVYPVYNDQTHLFTSTNISRAGYVGLTDVYIDDNFSGILKTYPYESMLQVNPTKLTSSFVGNDIYLDADRCVIDDVAVRKIDLITKDSYSRYVNFSSITQCGDYIQLNFTSSTNLLIDDRVYIEKDNPNVNPHYNTYGKVMGITGNSVCVDILYSSTTLTETGIAWEGSEYYDYGYVSGKPAITTTNPHYLNAGDSIYLQMDTWAVGVIEFVSYTSTGVTITQLRTAGIDLITGSIPFNTDIPTTIDDIVTNINSTNQSPKFTAYHYTGDDRLFVYTRRDNGAGFASSGSSFALTTSGGFWGFNLTPFHTDGGVDAFGTGWNPQFTGSYTVLEVLNANSFTIDAYPTYYNTPPGAERGSIYSRDRFIAQSGWTGDTYFVMNNSNLYDVYDYEGSINNHYNLNQSSKFLTFKPRDKYTYGSLYDIQTLDILYNSQQQATGYTTVKNLMVAVYSGGSSTPYTAYQVDVSDILNPLSGDSEWRKLTFGVGPANLNDIDNTYVSPTPPTGGMIQDYVDRYDVFLTSASTWTIFTPSSSEVISFTKSCYDWPYAQLIFINRYGSFEYVNLYTNYDYKLNIDRIGYERKAEKAYGYYDYGAKPFNRGLGNISTKVTRNLKMWTNWINLDESSYISEVYQSPEIYIYFPNDLGLLYKESIFPVTINDSEVKIPNDRSQLKQFEFNLTIGTRFITQTN